MNKVSMLIDKYINKGRIVSESAYFGQGIYDDMIGYFVSFFETEPEGDKLLSNKTFRSVETNTKKVANSLVKYTQIEMKKKPKETIMDNAFKAIKAYLRSNEVPNNSYGKAWVKLLKDEDDGAWNVADILHTNKLTKF